jgi:hypothetical protein
VAMGGWRRHDPATSGEAPGSIPAEIKRMYVSTHARARGTLGRFLRSWRRHRVSGVPPGWSWRPARRNRRPSRCIGPAAISTFLHSDTTETRRSPCISAKRCLEARAETSAFGPVSEDVRPM